MTDSKQIIPLESNPTIFTELAYNLGLSKILQFHDVYSLTDPDLLSFLPQPIFGIILLFPLTENYESYRAQQDSSKPTYENEKSKDILWLKQTIGNGCGLYALLHILINLSNDLNLSNSQIKSLISSLESSDLSVEEVSSIVEKLEASLKTDENFGTKGQTEAPPADSQINLHFITFIKGKDDHLYELDGRRNGPIDLGKIDDIGKDNLINEPKLVDKIQFYIDNADGANKHNFAIMALGPTMD
ncbi:YUH1 [Candida pseudojiufengensis]|uniref:YUH1 n=1 Tax=Candida pseudojiufengensis TaxID=497109 RepID=UPI002224FB53|nr:YUH1 [Candida pseudojiufengensis]KAI5963808.1 YUH1 [Candida pseudojiufengensis]